MASADPFSLVGKTALITGATRGIGEAIAHDFAQAGATILLTGRDQQQAEAVAEQIRTQGGTATGLAYDASISGAAQELASRIIGSSHTERLDVLVNNAAILRPHSIAKLTEEEFDEVFTVNTKSALFLSRDLRPLLEQGSHPSVINITAAGAHRAMGGIGAYCASKAAMVNLTATLAQEWAARGIRVNALTPGSVATDMILPVEAGERERFAKDMANQNLMKRLGEPREIARAARFLASEAASYITGQTLIVDGGLLANG